MHGDFRLGNLLAAQSRITAIIDWEIWSVGDPRVDAGWFLINCRSPRPIAAPDPLCEATPPVGELATTTAEAMGREVPELGWFVPWPLQVGRDLVADRQAQPAAEHARSRTGGDGARAAAPAVAGERVARFSSWEPASLSANLASAAPESQQVLGREQVG